MEQYRLHQRQICVNSTDKAFWFPCRLFSETMSASQRRVHDLLAKSSFATDSQMFAEHDECTQSGPETLGPAWIGNVRVTKNFTCSSCASSFVSKRCLSQYERWVHAGVYHSGLAIGHRSGNKRRWSRDEKVLLAREEIRLSGTSRNLNLDLSRAFPEVISEHGSDGRHIRRHTGGHQALFGLCR